MADINVRKRNSPVWPWILGLVIVIIAAIVIFNVADNDEDTFETGSVFESEENNYAMERSPVMEFDEFVNEDPEAVTTGDTGPEGYDTDGTGIQGDSQIESADTSDMQTNAEERKRNKSTARDTRGIAGDTSSADHNIYAKRGIMLMTSAVSEIANDSVIAGDTAVSKQAEEMQREFGYDYSMATDEKSLKQQISKTVDLLAQIQRNQYPDLKEDVDELRKESRELKLDGSQPENNEKLREFFSKANDLISEMMDEGMLGERLAREEDQRNRMNNQNEDEIR